MGSVSVSSCICMLASCVGLHAFPFVIAGRGCKKQPSKYLKLCTLSSFFRVFGCQWSSRDYSS